MTPRQGGPPTDLSPDPFAPKRWELRLFGDFRLTDPKGSPVVLANRKVEALLAILAVNHKFGIARDEAAEILWPGKPLEAQRSNFRQALSVLRKSIGPDAIESSRSSCRLSSSQPMVSDYSHRGLRDRAAFMPGHEGDWFETVRSEVEWDAVSNQDAPSSVVEGFTQTLMWLAESNPKSMLGLLQAGKALIKGIPPSNLLLVLGLVDAVAPGHTWVTFWRGASENNLHRSARFLEAALEEARRQSDTELGSEAVLELGKAYARLGRIASAKRVLKVADDLALSSRLPQATANAARARGVILTHWGNPLEGIAALARAETLIEDPLERATIQSSRFETL